MEEEEEEGEGWGGGRMSLEGGVGHSSEVTMLTFPLGVLSSQLQDQPCGKGNSTHG